MKERDIEDVLAFINAMCNGPLSNNMPVWKKVKDKYTKTLEAYLSMLPNTIKHGNGNITVSDLGQIFSRENIYLWLSKKKQDDYAAINMRNLKRILEKL